MSQNEYDLSITGSTQITDIEIILRSIIDKWPIAVFQSEHSKPILISSKNFFPIQNIYKEFHVYQDLKSYESWEKNGLTKNNGDKLITFFIQTNHIGAVVEDSTSKASLILREVESALQTHRISI